MCMAEQIAFNVLRILGFRQPRHHPDWEKVVDKVQDHIDKEIEVMKRVTGREN